MPNQDQRTVTEAIRCTPHSSPNRNRINADGHTPPDRHPSDQDVAPFRLTLAAPYFRYGHSAQRLRKIRRYAQWRLAQFIRRRHRRSMAFGWWVLTRSRPVDLGLIGLYGIVVAPRAGKPWRERPNAGGERRR
jgi:hypothetical protein